ncbi:hypothetical protein INS49_004279 [Diaporthe citri]|uniref:uncharacterized protein n=1 Tax=Diaporthe citri TaxID=83186 RepID=UPI001C820909|nr:uncharacterized protein INS49_004279 [Diaporthe citri]KAG6355198.1 hypothetical protein INS49_004279 [Diaporthe citri]
MALSSDQLVVATLVLAVLVCFGIWVGLFLHGVPATRHSPVTVAGRLDAGPLQVGDALLVQLSGQNAYVKALELDGESVGWAVAGQHVVIYLSHVDEDNIRIGNAICPPFSAGPMRQYLHQEVIMLLPSGKEGKEGKENI